ncbi:dipicolinate synthase subunit DpsA [Paenibacillus yanchengensis]|uniref:Dipicolinate synthase subunit DpsA n=1 Tax=Paenibacillus yanchengensis TaxID=2035833 RepID=A0ABW4YM10_9BACL
MLTGEQVLILGGDARQFEVMKKLVALHANVTVCGFEQCHHPLDGVLQVDFQPEVMQGKNRIILPAAGIDEQGLIASPFGNQPIQLTADHIAQLSKDAVIYTGMARSNLQQMCAEQKISLIELFERDDIAIMNSIPTAEGALVMAIENTNFTIHQSRAIVLGFGRTGFTMARVLHALGAKVKVGLRKPDQFARAVEMGLEPFYIKDFEHHLSNIDLIFNTIPTMIVTAQIIVNMPKNAVIIDLASKPGGTDFDFAAQHGVKAILAPGLPGIVAPQTAGRIIADCLAQLMIDDISNRRNE